MEVIRSLKNQFDCGVDSFQRAHQRPQKGFLYCGSTRPNEKHSYLQLSTTWALANNLCTETFRQPYENNILWFSSWEALSSCIILHGNPHTLSIPNLTPVAKVLESKSRWSLNRQSWYLLGLDLALWEFLVDYFHLYCDKFISWHFGPFKWHSGWFHRFFLQRPIVPQNYSPRCKWNTIK